MKKILSVTLTVILFMLNISIAIPAAAAVDNSKYIPKVVGTKDGNKLIFDDEIAKIARKMSSDVYGVDGKKSATEVAKTMQKENFKDVQIIRNENEKNGDLPLCFTVGVKNFTANGKEKHVLAIAFRGTTFNLNEIVADFLYVDLNGFHAGFYGSACTAFLELDNNIKFKSLNNMTFSEYLNRCKDGNEDYYILVTGHSLGGAIAGLFTADILAGFGAKNNIMCYTFGSPLVCSKDRQLQINAYNIFNLINVNDPVPKLGYDKINGVRLGIDLTGETTDVALPIPNHSIAKVYDTVTQQVLNKIDSVYKYTPAYYEKWNNDTNKGNGKHIHNYYYNDGKCYCGEGKNTATKTDNKSTLNINLTSYPTSIKQGSSFGLSGTISSNYNIKKVSGYIMQGNIIYDSSEDLPNKEKIDVKTAELNKSLNFGKLPVGNYSLYVETVDSSGQTVRVTKNFSVYEEAEKVDSTLNINLERYPVTIKLGTSFSLQGNISSNYTISKVRGYIYDANGSVVQSATDTPNSKYMSIGTANLNYKLLFGRLSSGNYTLKVEAVDSFGKVVTATKSFAVKDGNSSQGSGTMLRNGSSGSAVKELQQNLNQVMKAGLTVDGIFGNNTERAVRNFQSKYGLSVDGIAGPDTLSKIQSLINNSNSNTGTKPTEAKQKAITNTNQLLSKGSNGAAVKELQSALNKIMNAGLSVDGIFGNGTAKAVKDFQAKYGLSVDGIAGPDTLNKINDILK